MPRGPLCDSKRLETTHTSINRRMVKLMTAHLLNGLLDSSEFREEPLYVLLCEGG